MFKTINRIHYLFLLPLLSITTGAFAQTEENKQQINQAVFNKIEYHFNSQETDSIYALAGEKFRSSLSLQAFQTVMTQQMYPLGRIQSAELENYEKGVGTYKLNFISTPLQLILGVDSLDKIETFLFQPYKAAAADRAAPITSANAITQFDRFVDSIALNYSRKGNTHALAIGIINDGKTSSYYYGETEKGSKQLPDENTLFEIGSITKTFTATLLAYFAQQQLLSLDDGIAQFLPDSVASNSALQNITLKQLANHTSGLPRMPPNFNEPSPEQSPSNPYANYTEAHLYAYLKDYQAEIPPDSIYTYSNLGYGLLGSILTNVSDKSYRELIQEIISDSLQLKNTLVSPDTTQQHLAKAYNEKGEETPHWTFDNAMAAAGSLKSTVFDLLRFARAHFKLPETDLENALALTRQFTFFTPPDTDIGLGWHMNLIGGNLVYHHSGGTSGSSSFIALSPDRKVAIVMLSNTAEAVDQIALTILDFILNEQ